MAYIDKTTFNICQIKLTNENSFECDDLIAPVIRHLNLKGYKTKFCCAGHIYPFESDLFSETPPEKLGLDLEIVETKEMRNKCAEERILPDLPDDANIYYIKYLREFSGAYIAFEKGDLPDEIPDGWEVEDDSETEFAVIRKYFDGWYNTVYDFFEEQLKCMRKLKKWADDLPQKEEKESKE